MTITKDSVHEKTPFKAFGDVCDDCGTPHNRGYDTFSIRLPWRKETEVPKKWDWRIDEYNKLVDPLYSEFNYLVGEDYKEMEKADRENHFKRIGEILDKLDKLGTFLTRCEYQLKVTYDVGPENLAHCIISYTEYSGEVVEYADLFQANLKTIEELVSVYEIVSNGFDLDSTHLNIYEEGRDGHYVEV